MTDPRILDPDHAPTPFTADEIRQACVEGRTVDVRHEHADAPTSYWRTVFSQHVDRGVVITNQQIDDAGASLGQANRMEVTWDELQAHASFPAATTTISEEAITTELGDLDCMLYTVTEDAVTKLLWFATSRPGLPVRTLELNNGTRVAATEILADTQES
jgi:hypothetical protein